MIISNKILIERIKKIRKLKGLTQVEMAKMLNISKSTYNRIEIGEVPLYDERINNIAKVLEVPLFELLSNYDFKEGEILKQIKSQKINIESFKNQIEKQIEHNKELLNLFKKIKD